MVPFEIIKAIIEDKEGTIHEIVVIKRKAKEMQQPQEASKEQVIQGTIAKKSGMLKKHLQLQASKWL